MTALFGLHGEWLSYPAFAVVIAILLVIVFALLRKDRVIAHVRFWSFGFFLEARNDDTKPSGSVAKRVQIATRDKPAQ
jgi:hypothetical protein